MSRVGKQRCTSIILQKFPKFLKKHYQWLLPFFPVIPETFDLREYDLVISSSGAWSKGIVTKLDTIHIAYLHSPMRFVWDYNEKYLKERNKKPSIFTRLFFSYLRVWDRMAADRPDYLIVNSKYTQSRVKKYYRRESAIIYPPVSLCEQAHLRNFKDRPANLNDKGYFLIISRLSPYKKFDIAVEAFNKLWLPLVVIGQGKQENYLRKIAQSNVKILGWQSREEIKNYYKNTRAFIFPCEDDFGIAPVEAMQEGIPVIAYRKGGALETVVEGKSGEFLTCKRRKFGTWCQAFILMKTTIKIYKKHAENFSEERFKREFKEYINKIMQS